MIKVNVIVRDNVWLKYIKDPKIIFKKKSKKIQKDKFFSKIKYLILIYYYQAQKKYEL